MTEKLIMATTAISYPIVICPGIQCIRRYCYQLLGQNDGHSWLTQVFIVSDPTVFDMQTTFEFYLVEAFQQFCYSDKKTFLRLEKFVQKEVVGK